MKNKPKPYKTYKGHFFFPAALLALDDMKNLSGRAMKLLVDVGAQYTGYNNGDFSITRKLMKYRGWTSADQLFKARDELIERNLIMLTKQGGKNMGPNLYAITWQPICECNGKLDVKATLNAPRSLNEY